MTHPAPHQANRTTAGIATTLRDSPILDEHGPFIGYPAAAKITGASVRTLKRETKAGKLPCYRVGSARVLRLKTADVLALVERVA